MIAARKPSFGDEHVRFLSEVSSVLSIAMDYETALGLLARLATPRLADLCTIETIELGGGVTTHFVAATDPKKAELARELRHRYPPGGNEQHGFPQVVRTGKPNFRFSIGTDTLEMSARDAEHLSMLHELGVRSSMTFPLTSRGEVLGTLSVMMLESGRQFEADDLPLVQELAARAANTVDNARQYFTARQQFLQKEKELRSSSLRAEVGDALAASGSISETLSACAAAIVRNLPGNTIACVWTAGRETNALELQAASGALRGSGLPAIQPGDELAEILRHQTPLVANDLSANSRVVGDQLRDWIRANSIAAFAGYPLLAKKQPLGVLAVFSRAPIPEETHAQLATLADAIAQGIERVRAELALEERAKELARSNADLQQFAYVASHDLQEPLRMIAGFTQLLAKRHRGKLDPETDDYLQHITDGVARMQRLIDDLLTYSRVGSSDRPLVPVKSSEAAMRATRNLRKSIEDSDAMLIVDPLPEVLGEELQLELLFQNLLSNAIKFRSQNAPRVRVSAERDGEFWHFIVEDNGVGIDPQYWERIFVMFQRLHTREEYPGTGIGLAVCKRIVERHGGQIWVSPSQSGGTCFHFTLPAAGSSPGSPRSS